MSSDYDITTLKRAEVRRQQILDLLHENPGMKGGDIVIALPDYQFESIRGAIANMLAKREIAGTGPKREQVYFALVKTTISADAVRKAKLARSRLHNQTRDSKYSNAARERKRLAEAKRAQRKREAELAAQPWKIVHVSGNKRAMDGRTLTDRPIEGQRGQGALRRDVCVNCFQNY
jgi:hypothetical protein